MGSSRIETRETPRFNPDHGGAPPEEPAIGIATRIDAKDGVTPPLHFCPDLHKAIQIIQGLKRVLSTKWTMESVIHSAIIARELLDLSTITKSRATVICQSSLDFSEPHPHHVNAAQCLLVCVLSLAHIRLVWAYGIESRQLTVVLPCTQASFEDLRSLTGSSRPPVLRLRSDKGREFLSPVIRTYLPKQGVRQTVNSGYDSQRLAERWIGIVKVRATALLADVRLPPEYWSYACGWVACVRTRRVTEGAINESLPHFGGVVLVHQALKKPPSF